MTSNPQDFFNFFKDKSSLKQTVKNKQEEGLYLEFKQKRDRRNPILHEDDKKNFADGLSQFANSDGGVQIWGVKTKRSPNDRATELKPITQVEVFANNLMNYLKDAVIPSVDNVVIVPIFENKRLQTGYVKILIPASDKTPHRSMATREYYKRNMNGKYPLEHFDLEDMFGRRQKPYLRLLFTPKEITLLNSKQADTEGYLSDKIFIVYLNNDGRSLGRDAMAVIFCPEEKIMKINFSLSTIRISRIDDLHNNRPTFQLNLRQSIFYPTVNTRLGEMKVKIHKGYLNSGDASIKWAIYADNMTAKEGTFQLFVGKIND